MWLTLIDTRMLLKVTNQLDLGGIQEAAIKDPGELNELEYAIEGAFGKLASQLHNMVAQVMEPYCLF